MANHVLFPRAAWRQDVANHVTELGYVDWLASKLIERGLDPRVEMPDNQFAPIAAINFVRRIAKRIQTIHYELANDFIAEARLIVGHLDQHNLSIASLAVVQDRRDVQVVGLRSYGDVFYHGKAAKALLPEGQRKRYSQPVELTLADTSICLLTIRSDDKSELGNILKGMLGAVTDGLLFAITNRKGEFLGTLTKRKVS
jgi:hypothetical protein